MDRVRYCHSGDRQIAENSSLRFQVLVDTLANNKAFQRFAIRSNALLSDVSKKTTEHGSDVGQKSAEFFSVFKQEVCKR